MLQQARKPIWVGLMLAGMGTSSAIALPADMVLRSQQQNLRTTAGTSIAHRDGRDDARVGMGRAEMALAELHHLSGLTWDQLARLFGVSRRSLHFWASGKPMTPANEEHLHRLLATIRKVDRGSAQANRALLLALGEDGIIPFDLLVQGRYEQVAALVGLGDASPRKSVPPIAEATRIARTPRPPEELVGALQDRVHIEKGRLLGAQPIRLPREK